MAYTTTRRRSCDGKRRHPDRETAEGARRYLISRGAYAPRVSVYRCRHCAGWHTGHGLRGKR